MSKIGKKSIIVPADVEVKMEDSNIVVSGPKGKVELKLPPYVKMEKRNGQIIFAPDTNSKQAAANWGTARALVNNAVLGTTKGFEKKLEIEGVGYRVNTEGDILVLHIGFSHPVKFKAPDGVNVSVSKNVITVSGVNKDLVGRAAATIRSFKKPEPYKGKGIRYEGEVVRRKAGKKVASTTK